MLLQYLTKVLVVHFVTFHDQVSTYTVFYLRDMFFVLVFNICSEKGSFIDLEVIINSVNFKFKVTEVKLPVHVKVQSEDCFNKAFYSQFHLPLFFLNLDPVEVLVSITTNLLLDLLLQLPFY